ncbi:MAG: histidinol phosphate phosphatase domain-containing protein [Desulfobacteraceae bacterium]|nr:histidinol phosphate phosphatase domain-containing protein [Desulfobacteraceae bacterium]MBC2756916.1 histidinol phosphate phosphatase domain-containing protein [Desulfobacteraceae bacterium]
MIDLHTHSIFSDGDLIPAELARRAEHKGLSAIGITDHGDFSNIDFIIPRLVAIADELNPVLKIKIIPGIEITHVPPSLIADTIKKSRDLGAKIVIVHGETIVEPVATGTNRAAIDAGADILAHPGLISDDDVRAAKDQNVLLEITARKGHSLANGHVARLAERISTKMVINTDTHAPGDLIDDELAKQVICGAGLNEGFFSEMQANAAALIKID